jgi:hypothetical protein
MHVSHLGEVFTIVMAELGYLILLAVELVALQVLGHRPKNISPVDKLSNICWIFIKFLATRLHQIHVDTCTLYGAALL